MVRREHPLVVYADQSREQICGRVSAVVGSLGQDGTEYIHHVRMRLTLIAALRQ